MLLPTINVLRTASIRPIIRLTVTSRTLPCISRDFTSSPAVFKPRKQRNGKNIEEEEEVPLKHQRSSEPIIPGSQVLFSNASDSEEYEKAKSKMASAVEWFRRECASAENRANGRVTPTLLDSVRVKTQRGEYRLDEVATVGVRDGNTLIVTMFEEQNTKAVEQGLYASKLPNIIPQRIDNRTIKIPIPKPTVELRQNLVTEANRRAEEQRVICRNIKAASVKKGKYAKHSSELDEFVKLEHNYIAEIDKILKNIKKLTGAK
ncbi:ribosome recycling factor [Flagelloscypha sp. PMI_526]|nr:ribosome recycling factor [Flagelloscypha sp. PMI_526]